MNLNGLLHTGVHDADASLRCDESNDCRITVAQLRRLIARERAGSNRTSLIQVFERAIRRREKTR